MPESLYGSAGSRRYSVTSSSTRLTSASNPCSVPVTSRPPVNLTRTGCSIHFWMSSTVSFALPPLAAMAAARASSDRAPAAGHAVAPRTACVAATRSGRLGGWCSRRRLGTRRRVPRWRLSLALARRGRGGLSGARRWLAQGKRRSLTVCCFDTPRSLIDLQK